MSIANLGGVLKIFGGSEPSDEERAQLAQEVMLMTLARATAADTNIKAVEVETVREVIKAKTNQDVSAADVRVAAHSDIYEKAPLTRYVASAAKKLALSDRLIIASALADVIRSDERVSEKEINFYNSIAAALNLTPAQLAGLSSD